MSEKTATMKDTKTVIYQAYVNALAKIESMQSTKLDPTGMKKATMDQETVAKASSLLESGAESIKNELNTVARVIEEKLTAYKDVVSAIEIKNKEIKDMFGFENEMMSTAAAVDSHKELEERLKGDREKTIAELEKRIEELRVQYSEKQVEFRKEEQRRTEESTYSFSRDKRTKTDELKDHLNALRDEYSKELEARAKAANIREEEVKKQEEELAAKQTEFEELKKKVDEFPEVLKEEIKKAVGREKGILDRHFQTEKKFMDMEKERLVETLTRSVEEKDKQITSLESMITDLKTKLDSAYGEIKEMAVKTVEGSATKEAFDNVRDLLMDKGKPAGK